MAWIQVLSMAYSFDLRCFWFSQITFHVSTVLNSVFILMKKRFTPVLTVSPNASIRLNSQLILKKMIHNLLLNGAIGGLLIEILYSMSMTDANLQGGWRIACSRTNRFSWHDVKRLHWTNCESAAKKVGSLDTFFHRIRSTKRSLT